VRKTYQNSKIDTPDGLEVTVPEQVKVVMAEVAADMLRGCWRWRSAPACR
jgi:hypothetical protein